MPQDRAPAEKGFKYQKWLVTIVVDKENECKIPGLINMKQRSNNSILKLSVITEKYKENIFLDSNTNQSLF